jgi:outer membrane protein OmpA-like peptidoglycan-associated protein
MTLTLGVRVLPPVRGLAAIVGVDIGLTGTSWESAVRELALNDPYRVMIGASYAFDTRPRPEPEVIVREIPNEVEVPADVPPRGRLTGFVVEQREQVPVRNGIIEIMNHPDLGLNAIAADPSGRFATYQLPPGPVELAVTAEGYEPGGCQGTIPEEGGDVEVRCELVRASRVQIEDEEVIILEQIQFAFDSAEILPESFPLMQDIARTLNEHPEIRRVEIQGHTDTQGTHQYNMTLSQQRADSVMQWLVNAGVDAGRLEARGFGFTEPLVPNITDENRARNRRVQFIIKDRAP